MANGKTQPETEQLLSIQGVAAKLNVSKRTVFRMKAKGMLPRPFRVNRSLRWRVSTIDRWIARRCKRSKPAGVRGLMLIPEIEAKVHVEVQVWQGGRPSFHRDGQKVMRTIEAPASYDDGLVFDH